MADLPVFLEGVLRSSNRVCLEGDNQKQAGVLAMTLADVDSTSIRRWRSGHRSYGTLTLS
jgi:malonate decarboxylase alpha subunit